MAVAGRFIKRWSGAILIMLMIYVFSSRTGRELPHFGWADAVIKKGGHVLGYGLLALSYWKAFGWQPGRMAQAWALAVLYGFSDELHQSFVPGRHASAWDLLLFDATGAALALWAERRRIGTRSERSRRAN